MAWALVNVALLPDEPSNAWFFSKADREKVVIRVQENLTGIKNNELKWTQVREALLDVNAWFLVLIQVSSNIPNGGVTTVRNLLTTLPHSQSYALILRLNSSAPLFFMASASALLTHSSCSASPTWYSFF